MESDEEVCGEEEKGGIAMEVIYGVVVGILFGLVGLVYRRGYVRGWNAVEREIVKERLRHMKEIEKGCVRG